MMIVFILSLYILYGFGCKKKEVRLKIVTKRHPWIALPYFPIYCKKNRSYLCRFQVSGRNTVSICQQNCMQFTPLKFLVWYTMLLLSCLSFWPAELQLSNEKTPNKNIISLDYTTFKRNTEANVGYMFKWKKNRMYHFVFKPNI